MQVSPVAQSSGAAQLVRQAPMVLSHMKVRQSAWLEIQEPPPHFQSVRIVPPAGHSDGLQTVPAG